MLAYRPRSIVPNGQSAATAFLPYCTLLGEHIKVDFFTESMRDSLKRPIDGATELLGRSLIGLPPNTPVF